MSKRHASILKCEAKAAGKTAPKPAKTKGAKP